MPLEHQEICKSRQRSQLLLIEKVANHFVIGTFVLTILPLPRMAPLGAFDGCQPSQRIRTDFPDCES